MAVSMRSSPGQALVATCHPSARSSQRSAVQPPAAQASASSSTDHDRNLDRLRGTWRTLRAQAGNVEAAPAVDLVRLEQVSTSEPESNHQAHTANNGASQVSKEQTRIGVGVKVRGLRKQYKTQKGASLAVDSINLDIAANTITALVGPSGSGKTTLLRLIAGLEVPDAGQIFFDDKDATHTPVMSREIGFVFQSYALFKHMTVSQNIAFGMRYKKMKVDTKSRVAELLQLVQLPDIGDRKPAQLSGGQRQRVALARALATNPRLLLLDEPFKALDPAVRAPLRSEVKKIIQRAGITCIIVTHDYAEAAALSDIMVVFNKGRIEQVGQLDSLVGNPASPFVMDFLDDVNHFPSDCQFVRKMKFCTSKPMVMCSPKNLRMFKAPPGEDLPVLPALLTDRIFAGANYKYFLQFDDGVSIMQHGTQTRPGDRCNMFNQRMELHCDVEDDEQLYGNIMATDRVFVHAQPSAFMAFDFDEVDTSWWWK